MSTLTVEELSRIVNDACTRPREAAYLPHEVITAVKAARQMSRIFNKVKINMCQKTTLVIIASRYNGDGDVTGSETIYHTFDTYETIIRLHMVVTELAKIGFIHAIYDGPNIYFYTNERRMIAARMVPHAH